MLKLVKYQYIFPMIVGLLFGSAPVIGQDRQLVSNERLTLGTEILRSASVRAGDFDGDGNLDIVVANGRHWPQQNHLFLNQGKSIFSILRPVGDQLSTSYACEPADFDGDGDLDLAVGNDMAPNQIFLNDGTGKLIFHQNFGEPSSLRSLEVADLDSDGHVDLIATCRGRPNRVYWNDGDACFSHSSVFGNEKDSTIDVAVADLNADQTLDLILVNRDNQQSCVLLGKGQRKLGAPIFFGPKSASCRAVAVADFNQDGILDWAVANIGSANTIFFGDGAGGAQATVDFGHESKFTYSIAIGDMNNDGIPEIVVGNVQQANYVYFYSPTEQSVTSIAFDADDSNTYGLCLGDFNKDGFLDVATANSDGPNRVFLNLPKH